MFDRRGRGHSGDGRWPGAVLIGNLFGGAVALETARRAAPEKRAAVAVYESAVECGVGLTAGEHRLHPLDVRRRDRAARRQEIAIAGLDAAGLASAGPRPPGARRPDAVLALAPTAPRELRAVTAPGLVPARYAALDPPAHRDATIRSWAGIALTARKPLRSGPFR